jgi:Uma2 family endonuclease
MATAAPRRMTLAEFLEWDDGTETHYELVRGQVIAMTPPSPAHGRIAVNLGRHLASHRGTKLPDYRAIPSVREILLVSSQERRVELWRREGGRWVVEDLTGEAEMRLEAIGAAIPLAAVV